MFVEVVNHVYIALALFWLCSLFCGVLVNVFLLLLAQYVFVVVCVCVCTCVGVEFESLTKELFKPQLHDGVPVSKVGSKFSSDDLSSLLESPTNPLVYKSPYLLCIYIHI